MRNLINILQFSWPYMRRYWGRLVTAMLLGIVFGLSNGSFVWVTKTIFERLALTAPPVAKDLHAPTLTIQPANATVTAGEQAVFQFASDSRAAAYLWFTNGVAMPGATNASLVLSNVGPHLNGLTVAVALTNQFGGVRSSNATLQVQPNPNWKETPPEKIADLRASFREGVKRRALAAKHWVETKLDPWLPLAGRRIDWRQILGGLLILPITVAFSRYIGYLTTYCSRWVSERVNADLRLDVLKKLNTLSLDFFNRSTMGDLLTRVNSDTSALNNCMSLAFNDLIKEPITVICVFAALFVVDFKLTLLALIFLPTCFLPLIYFSGRIRRYAKSVVEANVSQASLLIEAFSGIRVVKAFGLEAEREKRYREFTRQTVHYSMKGVQAREMINPIIEIIGMFGLGMLIVVVFYTRTSLPELVGFLTGIVVIFTPLKKLANIHVTLQHTSVSVSRLMQVFAEKPTVKEPAAPAVLETFSQGIVFEQVSFAFDAKKILENISLSIPRGHKLGIAGPSGCGKSTLVNLVFRFYDPASGCVKIDGHDLRAVSSPTLRRHMALVSQEIVIFDQTAAENIACGHPGATRAQIEEAARQAYAHDFIMQLPQGYDTRLGERGVTLSVGMRQRISIARAFVRNAPILVLDEATASLDSQAEAEVQAAIDRLEQNRTVICIAHRLSTLAAMDQIIVLDRGQIIESGTFQELLRRRGLFADMARKQGIQIPE